MDEISQNLWYLDPDGKQVKEVVPRGKTPALLEGNVVRFTDPKNPIRSLRIPMHRVLMIEDFTFQPPRLVDPDALRTNAADVLDVPPKR